MPAWREVEGCQTRVARRRYGRKTLTYVEAHIRDEWVALGDPWPMVVPPVAEVAEEVRARLRARARLEAEAEADMQRAVQVARLVEVALGL